jgi:hypothetical protein
MTLVELSVCIGLLVIGVLSFGNTLVSLERGTLRSREVGAATAAAAEMLERIQAEAFPEAFRRYNAIGSDDPGGVDTAPGANFAVFGLSARPDDPDGLAGEVQFPSDAPNELREDFDDAALGMPRDLDGDGAVTAGASYPTTYVILPVRIRIAWTSAAGPGVYELTTVLGNYR